MANLDRYVFETESERSEYLNVNATKQHTLISQT